MYKENLLDFTQREEVRLLKTLFAQDGEARRDDFIQMLDIHEKTLRRRVKQINETICQLGYPPLVHYETANETYTIHKENSLNLDQLTYLYLKESTNFKILDTLWHRPGLSTEELIQSFFISRADYYKRLKVLNEWLEPFDIQIQKNEIVGEEWHLRFFAYQLYSQLSPQDFLYNRAITASQNQVIEALERDWTISFSQIQKERLSLWLSLAFERQTKQPQTPFLPLDSLEQVPALFQALDHAFPTDVLSHYLGKRANAFFEKRALQLFCVTFLFFPPKHPLIVQSLKQAEEDDDIVVQLIRQLVQEFQGERQIYTLSGLPDAWYFYVDALRAFLVKGNIFYTDEWTMQYYLRVNYRQVNVQGIIEEVLQRPPFNSTYLPRNREFLRHRCNFFVYKHYELFNKPVEIGVCLHADPLVTDIYTHHLKYELLKYLNVHIESYEEHKRYDLVISNLILSLRYPETESYILTNIGNQQEEREIHAIARRILLQRKSKDVLLPR